MLSKDDEKKCSWKTKKKKKILIFIAKSCAQAFPWLLTVSVSDIDRIMKMFCINRINHIERILFSVYIYHRKTPNVAFHKQKCLWCYYSLKSFHYNTAVRQFLSSQPVNEIRFIGIFFPFLAIDFSALYCNIEILEFIIHEKLVLCCDYIENPLIFFILAKSSIYFHW